MNKLQITVLIRVLVHGFNNIVKAILILHNYKDSGQSIIPEEHGLIILHSDYTERL